jgi:hypothetical protein
MGSSFFGNLVRGKSATAVLAILLVGLRPLDQTVRDLKRLAAHLASKTILTAERGAHSLDP